MSKRFSIDAIFTAKDLMTRPMAKIEGRAAKMARAMSTSLKSVDRAFGSVHRTIAKTATAFAGLSVAGGFVGANILTAGADFEAAMSSVAAVSLVTRDQVKDLEEQAKSLGKTTKFTATEVAQAMELMGRAGFSNAAIMKGVGGVLAAAAADGIEIAEAAGIVSNAIKGMGLDVEKDAGRVADVLALASARTNSSMSSLGESLSNVAATARQFRVPFETTVAAVALLQDVGLDASVAGTSLNTMLTKLATPTAKTSALMASLGLKFRDAKGDMLPLEGVLAELLTGLQKSKGNLKQAAVIAELFGMYGQKAASNLAEMAKKGDFSKLVSELRFASGAAQKMADIRMDNLLGDWELFTGAIDGVKLRLFDLQGGALRETIQGWTQWVEANEDLVVSKVGEFLRDFQYALPGIIKDLKIVGGEVVTVSKAVGGFVRELGGFLPSAKWIARGVVAFYGLSAAVKVTTLAVSVYSGAVRVAAAASALWGTQAAASGAAAASAATASTAYAQALTAWSSASTGAVASATGFRAILNSTASKVLPMLGANLSSLTGARLLGSAGLVAAAAAVGYQIGTWLDKATGFSEWVASFAKNDTLDKLGRDGRRGSGGITPAAAGASDAMSPAWSSPDSPAPDAVAPGERQRALLEEHVSRSETESREKVDVTINDRTGSAQVRRHSGGRSGARIRVKPTGAY